VIKEQRLALVIGNAKYSNSMLRSPVNDATLIGEELKKTGFDVMLLTNLSIRDMKIKIEEFGKKLAEFKGIGLFYFAGYGMQLNGENYLIPVDARIDKVQDIELEAIDLRRLMGEMEYAQNELNLIIIDASRDNPYSKSLKSSGTSGLASTIAPTGTFIAFSTTPGSISVEKNEDNSIYARALVKALQIPNLKLEEIFKKVRMEVYEKTKGQQIPWENSSLYGDFYFWKN
jgi:uncharacterized caspase-like protein